MTLADFLYQAGFWQWIGLIILFSLVCNAIAHGLSGFSLWCREKHVHYYRDDDEK